MGVVSGMHINKNASWVLIPARNEEDSLTAVIEGVQRIGGYSILVVDSLSSDATPDIARNNGATLISATEVGYLNALQTGYRFLLSQTDCTSVVQLDADGQHNPLHIPRLKAHIREHHPATQWVVGSRESTGTQSDGVLNLANRALRRYVQMHTNHHYGDISSGFWCLNRAAMQLFLQFSPPHQSADAALRLFAASHDVYPIEVPTEMGPRLSGKSMHHGLQTRVTHLINILRDIRWVNHTRLDR